MRARDLRKATTDAERLMWRSLRNRQFLGLKFRRQHPIGPFIADFACVELGLVLELDGGQHVEQARYDEDRRHHMQQLGFQTVRFWNHEVLNEPDAVLGKLRQIATTLTPTLSRRREREQDRSQT